MIKTVPSCLVDDGPVKLNIAVLASTLTLGGHVASADNSRHVSTPRCFGPTDMTLGRLVD
jgi:hypothetical protein